MCQIISNVFNRCLTPQHSRQSWQWWRPSWSTPWSPWYQCLPSLAAIHSGDTIFVSKIIKIIFSPSQVLRSKVWYRTKFGHVIKKFQVCLSWLSMAIGQGQVWPMLIKFWRELFSGYLLELDLTFCSMIYLGCIYLMVLWRGACDYMQDWADRRSIILASFPVENKTF